MLWGSRLGCRVEGEVGILNEELGMRNEEFPSAHPARGTRAPQPHNVAEASFCGALVPHGGGWVETQNSKLKTQN